MMVSGGQCGDLGQVVGQDSLPGPGFRSLKAVHAGAVPAVCAFEGADAAFASGSPLDGSAEGSASFQLLSGQAGPPFPFRGMTTVRTPRLFASYQGSAVLTNALGQPELMARQARRLEKWIAALNT